MSANLAPQAKVEVTDVSSPRLSRQGDAMGIKATKVVEVFLHHLPEFSCASIHLKLFYSRTSAGFITFFERVGKDPRWNNGC